MCRLNLTSALSLSLFCLILCLFLSLAFLCWVSLVLSLFLFWWVCGLRFDNTESFRVDNWLRTPEILLVWRLSLFLSLFFCLSISTSSLLQVIKALPVLHLGGRVLTMVTKWTNVYPTRPAVLPITLAYCPDSKKCFGWTLNKLHWAPQLDVYR